MKPAQSLILFLLTVPGLLGCEAGTRGGADPAAGAATAAVRNADLAAGDSSASLRARVFG